MTFRTFGNAGAVTFQTLHGHLSHAFLTLDFTPAMTGHAVDHLTAGPGDLFLPHTGWAQHFAGCFTFRTVGAAATMAFGAFILALAIATHALLDHGKDGFFFGL